MKQNLNRIKTQRGIALIDLVIALGVIAVIVAAIFSRGAGAGQTGKGMDLGGDISTLANGISNSYGGDYSTLSNANIINASLIKNLPTIRNVNGVLKTTMGGIITITPVTVTSPNDSFNINVTQVLDGACNNYSNLVGKNAIALTLNGSNHIKVAGTPMDSSQIKCANDNNSFDSLFN